MTSIGGEVTSESQTSIEWILRQMLGYAQPVSSVCREQERRRMLPVVVGLWICDLFDSSDCSNLIYSGDFVNARKHVVFVSGVVIVIRLAAPYHVTLIGFENNLIFRLFNDVLLQDLVDHFLITYCSGNNRVRGKNEHSGSLEASTLAKIHQEHHE